MNQVLTRTQQKEVMPSREAVQRKGRREVGMPRRDLGGERGGGECLKGSKNDGHSKVSVERHRVRIEMLRLPSDV